MTLKEKCVEKGMIRPTEANAEAVDVPEEGVKRRKPFKYDVTVYLTTAHNWDWL